MLVGNCLHCKFRHQRHFPSSFANIPQNRYLEVARLNESIGNHREALRCAERGLEIDIDCLGIDHPLYQESLKIVGALKIKV